jgi:lipoate-protein ligase A
MKRFAPFFFVAALLISAPGCGGSKGEDLTKDLISQMNDLAAAIEKKEPVDKIKTIVEKMKATGEKAKELKLTKEEDEKLQKKYEKDMNTAQDRMKKAMEGLKDNPEYAMQVGLAVMAMGK